MCRMVVAALAGGIALSAFATDREAPPVPQLTAAQIVERNVAARGGLEAWRKVETMVWVGHIESAHAPVPMVRFVMQQKRPNKTRMEMDALGDKTVRVFNGERGWKLKPDQQGHAQVKPFSFEEVTFAHGTQLIDGPLIDYLAKGNTVTLEALDEIDGHRAYRLSVRLATGEVDRIWIDAQTFLDVRLDRPVAGEAGRNTVSVFYREYKPTEGLQIPSVIETAAAPKVAPDRMVVERVILNAPMDDRTFARPGGHQLPGGMAADGEQQRPPSRRMPLVPSGVPAPYPFRGQVPSGPAAAPVPGPASPPGPGPASQPQSGPASAPSPGSSSGSN
jgi:hypothetical protein